MEYRAVDTLDFSLISRTEDSMSPGELILLSTEYFGVPGVTQSRKPSLVQGAWRTDTSEYEMFTVWRKIDWQQVIACYNCVVLFHCHARTETVICSRSQEPNTTKYV